MKSIENQFWKYVIPSMITVLLGGTFAFVDGVFIGQGTGELGLTAVNLVAPIAALVTALAAGIGMGGSIVMSTHAGLQNEHEVKKARGNTIFLLSIISIVLFIIGLFASPHIVRLLGAKDDVYAQALDYMKIVLTFGCFQLFSSGLSNLVINAGKSVLAMVVMVGALIINIGLDALFVLGFNMGTLGAALATVLGQAASAIIYIIVLLRDKKIRPTKKDIKFEKNISAQIIRTGLSPFGTQLAPSIVVLLTNYACVWTNGYETLAVFAVINQLVLAIQILFTGIGNGIQPIVSYCTGAGKHKEVHKTLRKAIMLMIATSGVVIGGIYFNRTGIPKLFNASHEVAEMMQGVYGYIMLMIPFSGFSRVLIPYLFASSQNKQASLMTYVEPLVLTPISLLFCCGLYKAQGIWPAMVLVQIILCVLGCVILKKSGRNSISI